MSALVSYMGDEKYIFISYAHRDADEVMPILTRMSADGYRFWFDAGIDPGTEWDENIARHINECGYFIAFMSKNYIASSNCKDELNYARDLEKQRVIIYLEEVTLPYGMAMRINRLQSVFKHKYTNVEDFYRTLYSSDNLQLFKGASSANTSSATEQKKSLFDSVDNEIKKRSDQTGTVADDEPVFPAGAKIESRNYTSGDSYKGEMKDNTYHGYGMYCFASGAKYIGEWRDGKYHGQGKYFFASGDKYFGEYREGKRCGKGTYFHKDGETYEGEYRDGVRCGYGVYKFNSGAKYEGMWENDKYHGLGKYTSDEGGVYEGTYANGKKNGQGKYTFASGAIYEGGYKDGEYDGQGTYYFVSGAWFAGTYKGGKRNGHGIYKYPDGSKYEGEYKNGVRHGKGVYTDVDGNRFMEEYSEDKRISSNPV